MNIFKKSHRIAGQSNTCVRKSQKHDANLRKNSGLYFQIGLILCLLGTYGLFEMKFEKKLIPLIHVEHDEDEIETIIPDLSNLKKPEPKYEPMPETKILGLLEPIIKDDLPPTFIETPTVTEPTTDKLVDPRTFRDVEKITEVEEPVININNVEVVPIYPGCENESTNKDRLQCMSDKLGKLVQRRFNTDLASEYGLSGIQRINVQFKIDKLGRVTEIKTRAPHEVLEQEAERLALKIPQMIPGKQRYKPVGVIYNLPIMFKVND